MTDSLPSTISVFPLPGILLLPRGELPLRVFEPRYVNLLLDCLGEGRLMGLIQTRGAGEPHPVRDDAPLYKVGCLGRVSAFMETQDGAFLITLTGISRFAIAAEAEPRRGYRRIRADYGPFAADLAEGEVKIGDRARMVAAAKTFLASRSLETDWNVLDKVDDGMLANTLAMACPLDPSEKQALLECPTTPERADLLVAMLELGAHDRPAAPTTTARH